MTETRSSESVSVLSDLIKDWASDSAPDIYSFVPYSWKFKILFHQFEMIWAANQHNWIDCSTKQQENGEQAALHETFPLFGSSHHHNPDRHQQEVKVLLFNKIRFSFRE